jgi:hypothetical protein
MVSARRLVFALALWLAAPVGSVHAAPLLEIAGGAAFQTSQDITIGWAFSISDPLTVTALGIWDQLGNGLVASHDVTLYTASGAALRSAIVDNSTSTAVTSPHPSGDWRFTTIASLDLVPGTYVIGATYADGLSEDLFRQDFFPSGALISITALSGVTYEGARFAPGFGFPQFDASATTNHNFGPNLLAEPTNVPEPATIALVGLGLATLMRRARRTSRG